MTAPAPRPAATVIVLRDRPTGLEVFLLQRGRGLGFMANAWVFPGGRVDPHDALVDHPSVIGGGRALSFWGLSRADGVGYLVAAIRETLEEVGIWLGDGAVGEDERARVVGGGGLGDLLDRTGATVDLDRLAPWSWWVTPEVEPRRYDTRFLLAIADAEAGPLQEHEAAAARWIRPCDALAEAAAGTLGLAPPTWWTLTELATYTTAADAAAALRSPRAIRPIADLTDGFLLCLPGDPRHPEPPIAGLPSRIQFGQGRWWATR